MRGDAHTIKERLNIVDVASSYIKLEKSGINYKARCPFHSEKTPSFFISPSRQTYYCFGCGVKGDIFTLVEEIEGLDFRGALKILADKAGVELTQYKGESKTERDKLYHVLEDATAYFEAELAKSAEAREYLKSRGVSEAIVSDWRLGYVPDEWRGLSGHLLSLGHDKEMIEKAGLIKKSLDEAREKEPYDVFRGRVIFPLFDPSGRVIAFSGRALDKETIPKYLNSPDTVLFTKSEVLYGLHKAKEEIRKKDYAVLVEGQLDLVLSHQAGVENTVASSGTAFTHGHLERLKRLSPRIILAFDGDEAGGKAAAKSAFLGLSLGMEVKIAKIPRGMDPADMVKESPETWKDALRNSVHAVEYVLGNLMEAESEPRKLGKLIEKRLLPFVAVLGSSIERSHFITLIAKRTGIREEVLWEDLKKTKVELPGEPQAQTEREPIQIQPRKNYIERRLVGIILWQESLAEPELDTTRLREEIGKRAGEEYAKKLFESFQIDKDVMIFEAESHHDGDLEKLKGEANELLDNFKDDILREKLGELITAMARAEALKDEPLVSRLLGEIQNVHSEMKALEESKKSMYSRE